jgi:hypothetical protein
MILPRPSLILPERRCLLTRRGLLTGAAATAAYLAMEKPAEAAWTLVGHTGLAAHTDVQTAGITWSSTPNLIIVITGFYPPAGGTLTDSTGSNVWTLVRSDVENSFISLNMYYCYNPTAPNGQTFKCAGTANYGCIHVVGFTGSASSPLDQQNGSGTVKNFQPGSITPTQNGTLVITGFKYYDAGGGSATVTSPFTAGLLDAVPAVSGTNFGGGIAYYVQATAAALNPTWSEGGSPSDYVADIASFKLPAVAGTTNALFLQGGP